MTDTKKRLAWPVWVVCEVTSDAYIPEGSAVTLSGAQKLVRMIRQGCRDCGRPWRGRYKILCYRAEATEKG